MRQSARRPVIAIENGIGALPRLLTGEPRRRLEVEVSAWIAARRWYAGKGIGHPETRIDDVLPLDGEADAALVVVAVGPRGETAQNYLLPLALKRGSAADEATLAEVHIGDERAHLVDALADDAFVRALAERMVNGDGVPAPRTGLVFHAAAGPVSVDALEGPVERSGAEQSNTSVRIGDAMLKAFRKLEPGVHPELEMTRHLTERTAFENLPALLGSLVRVEASGDPTALCVLQALVPNQGDAWSWTLDRLRGGAADALRRLAERIGSRTAELHRALAAPSDDPSFAPEPIDATQIEEWAEGVRTQARLALKALEQARPILHAGAGVAAERLLGRAEALQERIETWTPAHVEAVRTRIHGDYHLGQVLVSEDNDVFVFDFEGEPMRPLDERRAKHAPLKDVAGMLRSFDYAGAAAAQAAADDDAAARARGLAAEMAEVFLARYRQSISGCPSWPADPDHAERLLRLFLLEKSLYEIRYEAANRPDWLATPLQGVLALLDAPPTGAGADRSPPPAHRSRRP